MVAIINISRKKIFAVTSIILFLQLVGNVVTTQEKEDDFQEHDHNLEIGEAGKDEIAIAMAGGSLRAASSCFGVLRGFTQKKIPDPITGKVVPAMDLVDYNSAISGGTIPALLYAYAGVPTNELLETNRTIDPSKITTEELYRMPRTSMGYVIAQKPDFRKLGVLFMLKTILSNPFNLLKCHRFWTAALHEKIFKPLNVPIDKFFTSSKEELDKILKEYPKLKESDFLIPRNDVKTQTMILATMHGSRADRNEYMKKYEAIRDEAWNEYKAKETLAFFTNSFEARPNMTDIVLSIRDKHGGNLPMPYVFTPEVVENKYSGNVLVRSKFIQFPEKNVRPFEWGSRSGWYGRKSR
jgi:hypothetical protein